MTPDRRESRAPGRGLDVRAKRVRSTVKSGCVVVTTGADEMEDDLQGKVIVTPAEAV
jgi:hypothetical protein